MKNILTENSFNMLKFNSNVTEIFANFLISENGEAEH